MLILASGSKNRIDGLTLSRISFTFAPADIDEKAIQNPDIKKRQIAVARAKVEKVIADGLKIPPPDIFSDDEPETDDSHLVLGADGINLVGKKILEKPVSEAEAFDMIKLQSGNRCSFLTGFYAINTATNKSYQGTSETFYTFRELSDREIHDYVNSEPVLTWAAAFSPGNSMAVTFIDKVEGSYSNFNHSLPFDQLIPIFRSEGII